MQCEMCGKDASLKRTKVEGAELKLCDECQAAGEVVETGSSGSSSSSSSGGRSSRSSSGSSSSGSSSSSSSKRRKPRDQQESLRPDFDSLVRSARSEKDYTKEELADEIKEKTSVISRIESGSLKPDQRLARKLKKTLDVELYGGSEDISHQTRSSDEDAGGATIGDVASIERK